MAEITWATISVRLGLIVSYTLIPIYLFYQFTILLSQERPSEKVVRFLCHFACTMLWHAIAYVFAETDPGPHIHAQENQMAEASRILMQAIQEIRPVTDPWILALGGALCIFAVSEVFLVEEPTGDEQLVVDGELVVDEEPVVDEDPIVDGDLEPAPLEEFVWMLEDAQEAFLWRLRDIAMMLVGLVEEQVVDLLAFAAPVMKVAKN